MEQSKSSQHNTPTQGCPSCWTKQVNSSRRSQRTVRFQSQHKGWYRRYSKKKLSVLETIYLLFFFWRLPCELDQPRTLIKVPLHPIARITSLMRQVIEHQYLVEIFRAIQWMLWNLHQKGGGIHRNCSEQERVQSKNDICKKIKTSTIKTLEH